MSILPSDERQQARLISRRRLLQAGGLSALALSRPGTVAASLNGKKRTGRRCRGEVLHLDLVVRRSEPPRYVGPEALGAGGNSRPLQADFHDSPRHAHLRAARAAGPFDAAFQSHPLDESCRKYQQPFRRHAPLSERPGRSAGRLALHRIHPGKGPTQPAQHRFVCLADQVRRRPRLLRAEYRHRGFSGSNYSPLFVGSATNHPAMPGFRAPDELFPAVTPQRMQQRRRLLDGLDPAESPRLGSRALKDWQELSGRAFDLASGSSGRQPFNSTGSPRPCAAATGCIRWDKTSFCAAARRGGSRICHRQRLDGSGAGSGTVRTSQFQLGHARRRDGDGKRLRQRFVRHGLVLAAARRGTFRIAGRSQGSRIAREHPRGRRGRIRPHAAYQCVRRQSGASALAVVLFRDHRRCGHSRRNGVWRVRQDRRVRERQAGSPAGSRAPRSTTHWVSRSVFVWENDGFTRAISSGEPILDLFG